MTNTATFKKKLTAHVEGVSKKLKDSSPLQVLVYSESKDIKMSFSNMDEQQPFHIASIGKMCTASVIGILQDNGKLTIDDPINRYLSDDVLQGLFTFEGTDYSGQVTIRQLLGHTSGVADYFESKVNADSPFVDHILEHPDTRWTPDMLLDFTRTKQKPFGPPGTYGYSDTGYVLLGLIVEKVCEKPFSDVLDELIFRPLAMDDSYLMFYGTPRSGEKAIAPVYFNGIEISKKNLLSCDWAGGGIVSTTHDLLEFQKAFWDGRVVSDSFRNEMIQMKQNFRSGMHYGLGAMELHFNEFFFLLRNMPKPIGHSGILATHMYYDKEHDLHIICNFGSNTSMVRSIRTIITVEQIAKKYL